MKKILFVMPRLPFPKTSGRKTSLYYYCKILSQKLGYHLIVTAFLEKDDDPKQKPEFIDELIVLPKVRMLEKIKNIIINSFILGKKPMQVSLYWSKKAKKCVDTIIKNEKPDIVIADMIRTTEYLADVQSYKISDLDDMISLRYERQLEVDFQGINPYGAYLKTLPSLIQKILLSTYIKKIVVKYEIKLLKKYELEMGKIFDKTIFVAEKETQQFNRMLGENKAFSVPIGVDIEYFAEPISIPKSDELYIGFLGAMSVAHNENAVIHFIEDIFPHILRLIPSVKFIVVGGGGSEKLKKYASSKVMITGRVPDVRFYIKQCKVFVCPLTFGSGIKTKNLEAMAMGVPIVTTEIGAENIHAVSGEEWIIANSDEEFAKNVVNIINDRELFEKLRDNALKFVINNFTWSIAERQFTKLLKEDGK